MYFPRPWMRAGRNTNTAAESAATAAQAKIAANEPITIQADSFRPLRKARIASHATRPAAVRPTTIANVAALNLKGGRIRDAVAVIRAVLQVVSKRRFASRAGCLAYFPGAIAFSTSSTRRFFARPSSVLFGATGLAKDTPTGVMRSFPTE